ncbi:MAG: hypothetical protein GX591_00325 [Planctomycetes bacterium]|nr:hypothetical protein [Planctomycetota bacterium]
MALVMLPAGTAAAQVRIEAVEMGFSGVYRPGHMVPVFVKLATANGEPFDGELRAVQTDDDGEHLHWRQAAPLSGGEAQWRQVLLCPQGGALRDGALSISYGSADGGGFRPVASVDLGGASAAGRAIMPVEPVALAHGQWVVGTIGPGPGPWKLLEASTLNTGEPVHVVAIPTSRVPIQWQGLDMVDVIYWDDPQADQLTDEQRQALVQWVWRGGHLILGLGSHARELAAAADLSPILPVTVEQLSVQVSSMQALHEAVGQRGGAVGGVVVRVAPRRGARVAGREGQTGLPLLCRWAKGSGTVTAVSTTLDQTGFARGSNTYYTQCLAALAGLQVRPRPVGGSSTGVTGDLTTFLDSTEVGNLLVVIVILLCVAYALVAGPGTWMIARFTKRTHLSWWWFGLVVAVATGASVLFSLFGVRGESATHAVVLDLADGSTYGVAQGYVGLYVPAHRSADVSVEDDPHASLTPMVRVDDPAGSAFDGYPDPRNYEVSLASPGTLSPYVRRTIKRLALSWRGDVGHAVTGRAEFGTEIDAFGTERALVTGSVTNDLPADLADAVLVVARPGPAGRGEVVEVLRLGALPAGQTVSFTTARTATGGRRTVGAMPLQDFLERLPMLRTSMMPAGGRTTFLQKVQLLSTMSRFVQPGESDHRPSAYRCSLVRMDRGSQIHPGQALLIAQAGPYLPVPLRVDGNEARAAVDSETIVRVLLPAHPAPPAAAPAPGSDGGGQE